MASEIDHFWKRQAQSWEHIKSPLRPSRADIEMFERLSLHALGTKACSRVVVLGVTPEILLMNWPEDTFLIAVERSREMVENVYSRAARHAPENLHLRSIVGHWQDLPELLKDDPVDLVIGDGCYTQLTSDQYTPVTEAIRSSLKSGGAFIHRFFIKREQEDASAVLADLAQPFKVDNFSAFKLRLLMACQQSFEEGVVLGEVCKAFENWTGDNGFERIKPQRFSQREMETILNYWASQQRYTFPTHEELRAAIEGVMHLDSARSGGAHELRERCVMLTMS